jgi:hypothetical protein
MSMSVKDPQLASSLTRVDLSDSGNRRELLAFDEVLDDRPGDVLGRVLPAGAQHHDRHTAGLLQAAGVRELVTTSRGAQDRLRPAVADLLDDVAGQDRTCTQRPVEGEQVVDAGNHPTATLERPTDRCPLTRTDRLTIGRDTEHFVLARRDRFAVEPGAGHAGWLEDLLTQDLRPPRGLVDGAYVASVSEQGADLPNCVDTASYDAATFRTRVSFPRSCFGNPAEIRFLANTRYNLVNPLNSPNIFYQDQSPNYINEMPAFSEAAARARIATSLSSAVSSSTVTYGESTTVSGKLTRSSNGKVLSGQKVGLYRKYPGGSYAKIATATTNSKGNVSFSVKPSKNASYQLRHKYAGRNGPGYDSVRSAARTIQVRTKVGLAASTTRPKAGTTVKLSATVSPKHAGHDVVLQRRRADGTWKTVARSTLNSSSSRTFKVTAGSKTVGTYRVVVPKHHDHAKGTSPKVTIKLG